MSEWGYIAKIIKQAKKSGKLSGKRAAKEFADPKIKRNPVVSDTAGYNEKLRNFLDTINDSRYSEGYTPENVRLSAQQLNETLDDFDLFKFGSPNRLQFITDYIPSNQIRDPIGKNKPLWWLNYIENKINKGSYTNEF